MPLSSQQIQMLKHPATKIEYQQRNPRQPGTKSHERYNEYKAATSIQEATEYGAKWEDFSTDFDKGFLKFQDGGEMVAVPGKRAAPTGSPERMGQERGVRGPIRFTEAPDFEMDEKSDTVTERVEMNAATAATLRMMMREEIQKGVDETEKIVARKLEESVFGIREELASERACRQSLEQRVLVLEEQLKNPIQKASAQMDDDMDKSVVVVGGFGDLGADEAEIFVNGAMSNLEGYQEVYALSPNPKVVFTRFATAQNAKKFLRTQKRQSKFKDAGLWASENRSMEERRRARTLSKMKKFLIELGNYEAKDVVINYNTFRVHVRVARKLCHVANVAEDATPEWIAGDTDVDKEVKEALQQFLDELEQ